MDAIPDSASGRFDELKELDGHGSGLDADKLDGYDAQYILARAGLNPPQYFNIYVEAPADEQTVFNYWIPDGPIYLYRVGVFAMAAPEGADLTFRVLQNNVEVGSAFGLADGIPGALFAISPAIVTVGGDYLGIKCKSVGTGVAGSKVTITLYFTKGMDGARDLKCSMAAQGGIS